MIEIAFSDSACGSLKMAQHYGKGKYHGGGVGVIVSHSDGSKPTKEEIEAAQREAEKREQLAWENAIPLGGNSADVYGFGLALSIGDISENEPDIRRKQVMEWLYSIYPDHEGHQAAGELLHRAKENLKTVRSRAAEGEALRVWYSNQPDELCGMYWLMAQLDPLKENCGPISLVRLPEWEVDENDNIVRKSGWGDIPPGEWHRYLPLEGPAPQVFIRSCATHWQTLQSENAPLRAMLNGQLISAPETLYDDFITREIAAEGVEFQEAMIVGRVLGKYKLGIGDAWVALRIEEMIRKGILEPVNDSPEDAPIYHRKLRKRKS